MRKKSWINVAPSFEEAERFDRQYYQAMTPQERLETVQLLREQYYKIRGTSQNAKNRKRLRRVITIIKQK